MPANISSYSYAVFRYVKDAQRDVTVPIGVALWSSEEGVVRTRLLKQSERISRISKTDDYPYIDLIHRKLGMWLSQKKLPYQSAEMLPTSDAWRRHLRNVLVHKVRVSEPLSIDCENPDIELEPLFTAIVKASPDEESAIRIDGLVRHSLGEELAKKLHRGAINGFAGKPVQMMRLFLGIRGDVAVDAVNLSTKDAARDADAMVGKLWRARECHTDRPLVGIIGYLSSPGGLNGEAFLKDWMERKGQVSTFDIVREQEQFREATERAIAQVGPPRLFAIRSSNS